MPIEGAIHLRSHNIPLMDTIWNFALNFYRWSVQGMPWSVLVHPFQQSINWPVWPTCMFPAGGSSKLPSDMHVG